MFTVTEENYLKQMLMLSHNGNTEISVRQLSEALGITMPTVNSMVKRFAEKGLITYTSYKPFTLTTKGHAIATALVRRHRLTEMFLVSIMGFTPGEVHAIAEELEHISHERFFNRMDEMLGYPTHDPHGSPIPPAVKPTP